MTISRETVLDLAPRELEMMRGSRYRADEQAIALAALPVEDQPVIVSIYEMLEELGQLVADTDTLVDATPIIDFTVRREVSKLLHIVRRLGASVPADAVHLAEALHDIRGGALTTLFVQLARIGKLPWRDELARGLAIATRDQMKMMRNVIRDIDPVLRERDLAFLPHSLFDVARAVREFRGTVAEQPVEVAVDCPTDGVIADSCVEVSAVDRVTYNLLNNAVRYADQPRIHAWLLLLEGDLRVAIANAISPQQHATIAEVLGSSTSSLFGTFTTSGSGYGLRIVSELVGRAYGVASVDALVAKGYIGAKLEGGDTFVTWFHWPLSGA